MKGYKCTLQIDKLNKKREDFWNTRNAHGAPNYKTWRIINQACVYDEYRANVVMEENNLTTFDGCINHIVDKNGIHYIVPNYCINDPYFEKEFKENNPSFWYVGDGLDSLTDTPEGMEIIEEASLQLHEKGVRYTLWKLRSKDL